MRIAEVLDDTEFGHIYMRVNARAVRYTYHPAQDPGPKCGLTMTVPPRYDRADVLRSVEKVRPALRDMLQKHSRMMERKVGEHPHIDWDFGITSECVIVRVEPDASLAGSIRIHNEPAEVAPVADGEAVGRVVMPARLIMQCPPGIDWDADRMQQWLEEQLVEGLRLQAKAQLVPRLLQYAARYGIDVREVKVNNSRGHWGSCVAHHRRGGRGGKAVTYFTVNLSLMTLLLPLHIQRLVMLHELTHTRHMDHSPAFHHNLDGWLDGQEKALEAELKRYTTSIFSFAEKKK